MFGVGAKNALPQYEKADALYKNESKEDILKPYRGRGNRMNKCSKNVRVK